MNQPDTAAGNHHPDRPPAFRVVLRGYDRAEVDEYLPQLMARLSEAVDRYAEAEQARAELEREIRSLREGSFQQLGGDAAAVMQEAGRSGEQLVERARQRADNIVHKAQTQAEQLRAEVTSEAQKALAQARQLAEQIRREAEHEQAALQRERQQVRELHDGLLADLRRVHRGDQRPARADRHPTCSGADRRRTGTQGRTKRQGRPRTLTRTLPSWSSSS